MASNFLEQLAAEWHELQGYFVRRNILVGPRPRGGYEGELDVVALHPDRGHLIHIECSMDANSWATRENRFTKKFEIGRRFIPELFGELDVPSEVDQVALLGYASKQNRSHLAGGRIVLVSELICDILAAFRERPVASAAVPEQFSLLRTLQFVSGSRTDVIAALS